PTRRSSDLKLPRLRQVPHFRQLIARAEQNLQRIPGHVHVAARHAHGHPAQDFFRSHDSSSLPDGSVPHPHAYISVAKGALPRRGGCGFAAGWCNVTVAQGMEGDGKKEDLTVLLRTSTHRTQKVRSSMEI